MRARVLITTFSMLAIACIASSAAFARVAARGAQAADTGGTAPATGKRVSRHARRSRIGNTLQRTLGVHAPITAKTPDIEYGGPIYEKTATGQIVAYVPPASAESITSATGGMPVAPGASAKPELLVPGSSAEIVEGLAAAPMSAPAGIQEMIWAGNEIVGKPYIYGGGHQSFESRGYDCSGTVSYALHGASLIEVPMDSSEMMSWGGHGIGRWVTIFANPGHAYMTIAGLRLDTSSANDPSNLQGPRWRPLRPENSGFVKRHPNGL